jgi:transposase
VALLADLDSRIVDAETELAPLLPLNPLSTLTSVPGWGVVRVSNYAAALGDDPTRWPAPKQTYRASGLSPMQYESAGKPRDGSIRREDSVALRAALIDLGVRWWLTEPAAKSSAHRLKDRGKRGGVNARALAIALIA